MHHRMSNLGKEKGVRENSHNSVIHKETVPVFPLKEFYSGGQRDKVLNLKKIRASQVGKSQQFKVRL